MDQDLAELLGIDQNSLETFASFESNFSSIRLIISKLEWSLILLEPVNIRLSDEELQNLSPYLFKLVQKVELFLEGKFLQILTSSFLFESSRSSNIKPTIPEYIELVRSEMKLEDESDELCFHLDCFLIGLSSFLSFVQYNFTGPLDDKTNPLSLLDHVMIDDLFELEDIEVDGCCIFPQISNLNLLKISLSLMNYLSTTFSIDLSNVSSSSMAPTTHFSGRNCPLWSFPWIFGRMKIVQLLCLQVLLYTSCPTLFNEILYLFSYNEYILTHHEDHNLSENGQEESEFVEKNKISDDSFHFDFDVKLLQILSSIEIGNFKNRLLFTSSNSHIERATGLRGLNIELVGEMGKRTKYQKFELALLKLKVATQNQTSKIDKNDDKLISSSSSLNGEKEQQQSGGDNFLKEISDDSYLLDLPNFNNSKKKEDENSEIDQNKIEEEEKEEEEIVSILDQIIILSQQYSIISKINTTSGDFNFMIFDSISINFIILFFILISLLLFILSISFFISHHFSIISSL